METNKKIFLDLLPRKIYKGRVCIDWITSIGYKVHFIYDDIESFIEIVDYKSKNHKLHLKYFDEMFIMGTSEFKACKLGAILGKRNSNFKIEIGTRFQDDKRDITIIDSEYRVRYKKDGSKCNDKWYKYHCNICNWDEGRTVEDNILRGSGCSCCAGKTTVLGINTIWDTDRWMCDLGVSEEDAKTHTKCSGDNINVVCPDCGKEKCVKISNIYIYKSISCKCSDGISYPNKFAYELINQLNKIYELDCIEHEYSPDWIGLKRYDNYFVFKNKEYILEMDGGFHNIDNNLSGQTKEKSKAIDDHKDEQARLHGIKVIRIDCNYGSENRFEYIKENILQNYKMNELFDLSNIDWLKCNEFALSNLVKKACEYKRNNPNMTTGDIGKIMGKDRHTIRRWLTLGTGIWCEYNVDEENNRRFRKRGKKVFKPLICIDTEEVFKSITDCSRQSLNIFGFYIEKHMLSDNCNQKRDNTKGYSFKFISDLTCEEYIKYGVENKLKELGMDIKIKNDGKE